VESPWRSKRGADFAGKFGTQVAACNYTDLKTVYEASDDDWGRTGTWEPDPLRYPRGIEPLSE
jgi:hypothetical protein